MSLNSSSTAKPKIKSGKATAYMLSKGIKNALDSGRYNRHVEKFSITNIGNTFGITKLFYNFIYTFVKYIFIHYAYISPRLVYLFYFFHFGRACAFSFDHDVRFS